ncbi:MAG: lytic transglycosylase domain-containing protein [Acidimicrobiales bacterium]
MTDDRLNPRADRTGRSGRSLLPSLVALVAVLGVPACSVARPSTVVAGTLAKRAPTTPRAVVETPEALATRLTSVETAIRDPATPDADLDRLGRSQQDLYRMLAARPEWHPAVAAAVAVNIRSAVEANLMAESELARLGEPGPDLPHWHIVAPAPSATLVAHYKAAEAAVGVPWPYLAAIHLTETRMSRIRGNSSAGAQGPMQFLPASWAIYGAGGDINSDHDAILAAARLLKSRGAPGDMDRALFAYNNSDHYVKAIVAYAEIIRADERAYRAYHGWQVYYGDRLLPEGFDNP